jgi:TonB-linked SusC/RagA family outer membrane protein
MHVSKKRSQTALRMLLAFALLLMAGSMWAQNITVKGRVIDTRGDAVVGAAVVVKGTRNGVSTNESGQYLIKVAPDATLEFSFLGLKTVSVPVNNRTTVDVVMADEASVLGDVVMVAYGSQKKESLTGAVSTVDVKKNLDSRPIADVGRALQGTTAGLIVTSKEGALGGSPTIKIRGNTSTLGGGTGNPLVVLDNVEVPDLSYVNPDDIESISILKDASTTAIYGARAAFGAILITTKKGQKEGGVQVRYSNNLSWSRPTKVPEPLRPDVQLTYSWLQRNHLNATPTYNLSVIGSIYYNPDMIVKVKEYWDNYKYGDQFGSEMVVGRDYDYGTGGDATKMYFYRSWDLYNLYYNKTAPQQNHNISITGGSKNTKYNLSVGSLNQRGMIKPFKDTYKRLNVSANLETDVNKYLTVRSGYMLSKNETETPFVWNSTYYPPIYYMYRWSSIYPYGTFNGVKTRNAITELEAAKPVEDITFYHRLNLGTSLHILKGLDVNFDYVASITNWDQHKQGGNIGGINMFNTLSATAPTVDLLYNPSYSTSSYNYIQEANSTTIRNTYNGNIQYENTFFDNHYFKVQVGANIEDSEYKKYTAKRMTPYDPDKGELNLAGGDQTISSEHTWWSVAGFYARLNYSFKDKYYLELNGRYDGSSRFASDARWGLFPSASAAWRITEEPWMINVKDIMPSLKLRLSVGSNGNQDVPVGSFSPTMTVTNPSGSSNYWLIGGAYTPYVGLPYNLIDPNITWETVTTYDVGLDASFFKGDLSMTFDLYRRITSDMLSSGTVLPVSIGASAPKTNFGELTTDGYELTLNYGHTFSNGLRINIGGQLTDYKSTVTKWNSAEDPTIGTTNYYDGFVIGDIWGFEAERLFQKSDFEYGTDGNLLTTVVDGKTQNVYKNLTAGYQKALETNTAAFMFGPGDVMFKDLDGDGIIDYGSNTIGDPGDRRVIGNSQPRYIYGIRLGGAWMGFDLDMFFQGVGKRNLWATGNTVLPGYTGSEQAFKGTDDYWTEDNTGAFFPRPRDYGQTAKWNYVCNSRYLLNMAYLRLKSLVVGYTLPTHITQKAMIQRARIYFSGENLLTFDKLANTAVDPETDWTAVTEGDSRSFGRSYPYSKSISFGIQIDF